MPCNQVQTSIVTLERCNVVLLGKAMTRLGWLVNVNALSKTLHSVRDKCSLTYNQDSGQLTIRQSDASNRVDVAAIKRAYSAQVVAYTAQRNGFQVEATATPDRYLARKG